MLFELGQEIRKVRKLRQVTQEQIARELGMSRATISQLEAGTVQEIGIRKVIRVLDYLGLELQVRKAGAPPTLDELREERWEAECSQVGKRRQTP
ncbi:helix-turn-helix domain-containing protein [Geomonas anaerohicana]|uniref:Helix-turn-helix transcriptional regulator n=1 Tax=Geomonas anaerohicana TaxID=2798583 RepID=A0ABS0YFS3_9BACT|nr:helix-turn-helix transcriptional regulator [Geomonas anaerohicana]MBJ6750989.1 helix-turn-helix transcriptional regulator [Geomonas anaerohicana]